MDKKTYYQEIYNRYGYVTRARNCFLYTKKGVRVTDMYQENGRAILGWDAGNAFTFFKNTMNRGQVGSFISQDKSRVQKAISQLLNTDREILYFSSKADAIKAGLTFSTDSTSVYKPWNPQNIDYSTVTSVIIIPTLPWTDTIYIAAIKKEAFESVDSKLSIPNQITLPYALEAGIARAVFNLIAELPLREEKNWFIYDTILTKYWTRKGPYLYPKMQEQDYDTFVLHCMDCGIAINPNYNEPSIVPFGADKGVFTALKNNAFQPTI